MGATADTSPSATSYRYSNPQTGSITLVIATSGVAVRNVTARQFARGSVITDRQAQHSRYAKVVATQTVHAVAVDGEWRWLPPEDYEAYSAG